MLGYIYVAVWIPGEERRRGGEVSARGSKLIGLGCDMFVCVFVCVCVCVYVHVIIIIIINGLFRKAVIN